MRRCISEPTIRFPRPAPRSVATSAFTTPGALIRALTGRRQTMLTSLACRTSRQPEPGRRSTYQNRNAVQTNRATAECVLGAAVAWALALELAMGFLLRLGAFERLHLGLGEHQALLRHLGFQSLQPVLHGGQVVALPDAAYAGRGDGLTALGQLIGDPAADPRPAGRRP